MKWYGLLLGLFLISTAAFSAPPQLVELSIHNDAQALPIDTIAAVPGVYIRYPDSKFQLVMFNAAIKPGETLSQSLYVPANVESIKPMIAYIDKANSQHYWYCKDAMNLPELADASHANRLEIKFQKTALQAAQSDATKTFGCSYQKVAIKRFSE